MKVGRKLISSTVLSTLMPWMDQTRLAGNVQFGFLDETHALHPCYLYLRDQAPHEAPSAARSAVRLLGDEYQEVRSPLCLCVWRREAHKSMCG
jgi:hypothetical protein